MSELDKLIDEIHAGITDEQWDDVAYRMWLQEMYPAMDFLMKSGAWEAINAYLGTLMSKDRGYDEKKAIAALRFLSDAPRDRLAGWHMLLWRTQVYIEKRGLDPAMLRGLDGGNESVA